MWLVVKSPTLWGSPTVITKLGLAACSMLTLGWFCLLIFSVPPGSGCPCRWYLCREFTDDRSSSPASDESSVLRPIGKCDGAWRTLRIGSGCSFEGGIGGCSGSVTVELSPNGPKGLRESSTGSNRVAGNATFFAERGPLLVGVLGDGVAGIEGFCADWVLTSPSRILVSTCEKDQIAILVPCSTSVALFVRFAFELERDGTSVPASAIRFLY